MADDARTTPSGIPIEPFYEGPEADPRALGKPGEYPYTRGVYPTMYRGRPWTMRQYAGFATAAESNRRYRYLLSHGVTGLSVAFDLPTQIGYDSDHPLAAGEVGRVGVAIDSIEDMAVLFDGIPLDKVSTSMTINSTAIILLALYVAVARRQGVDARLLDYQEHTLSEGARAQAASYIEVAVEGKVLWGIGIDANTTRASLTAVVSAVNRAMR